MRKIRVIKDRLPKTTTERLLRVAELIEGDPSMWDQAQWSQEYVYAVDVAAKHTCGTVGCIAGWTVALMPVREVSEAAGSDWLNDFTKAASVGLGLKEGAAIRLFDSSNFIHDIWNNDTGEWEQVKDVEGLMNVLRYLASLDEPERLKLTSVHISIMLDANSQRFQSELALKRAQPVG